MIYDIQTFVEDCVNNIHSCNRCILVTNFIRCRLEIVPKKTATVSTWLNPLDASQHIVLRNWTLNIIFRYASFKLHEYYKNVNQLKCLKITVDVKCSQTTSIIKTLICKYIIMMYILQVLFINQSSRTNYYEPLCYGHNM